MINLLPGRQHKIRRPNYQCWLRLVLISSLHGISLLLYCHTLSIKEQSLQTTLTHLKQTLAMQQTHHQHACQLYGTVKQLEQILINLNNNLIQRQQLFTKLHALLNHSQTAHPFQFSNRQVFRWTSYENAIR